MLRVVVYGDPTSEELAASVHNIKAAGFAAFVRTPKFFKSFADTERCDVVIAPLDHRNSATIVASYHARGTRVVLYDETFMLGGDGIDAPLAPELTPEFWLMVLSQSLAPAAPASDPEPVTSGAVPPVEVKATSSEPTEVTTSNPGDEVKAPEIDLTKSVLSDPDAAKAAAGRGKK